jgi:hypothetical protein
MQLTCELAPDEHPGAFRTNRLVMRMSVGDRKDLSRPVHASLTVLGHDESAGENKAPDCEGVPMLPFCGSWLEALSFNFGVAVGSKLRLEFDLIHVIFPLALQSADNSSSNYNRAERGAKAVHKGLAIPASTRCPVDAAPEIGCHTFWRSRLADIPSNSTYSALPERS